VTASTGSAYPVSVDELLPRAREWMADLGKTPSRNQIMSEFKVGAPKAKAIRDALTEAGTDMPGSEREGESRRPDDVEAGPVRVLHSVPVPGFPPETDPVPAVDKAAEAADTDTQVTPVVDPGTDITPDVAPTPAESAAVDMPADSGDPSPAPVAVSGRPVRRWPVVLLALPAFVAIWGGWVGLGRLTGFGPIQLLPGIWDDLVINSAITLPIGVEVYAAFALRVWLSSGRTRSDRARGFAKWSAFGSLALGMAGQVAYHLMSAAGITVAPWLITTFVACLPVVVLGCGAALAHLMHEEGTR
jgi:hypothetical protein